MSAAGRSEAANTGHSRHADDFYATPGWCTSALLHQLVIRPNLAVLEPAAGEGAIVRELLKLGVPLNITAVELDPKRSTIVGALCRTHRTDFLRWAPQDKFDLIITNPPFAMSMEFVEASLRLLGADGVCAMLLRLNWLASMKRARFLQTYCPDVFVLPRRPSFTGGGTDATDYGWFVWRGPAPRERGEVRVLAVGPIVSGESGA